MPGIDEFTPQYFDESSKAWMANKIRLGAGMVYRCSYAISSTRQCPKAAETGSEFCEAHCKVPTPKKVTKTKLRDVKIHKRETDEDVILRLIDVYLRYQKAMV